MNANVKSDLFPITKCGSCSWSSWQQDVITETYVTQARTSFLVVAICGPSTLDPQCRRRTSKPCGGRGVKATAVSSRLSQSKRRGFAAARMHCTVRKKTATWTGHQPASDTRVKGPTLGANFGPTLWVRTTSGRCFGVSFGAQKSIRCCATLSKVLTNLLRELHGFHIDTKWHSTSANIPASAPSLKPLSSSTSLA